MVNALLDVARLARRQLSERNDRLYFRRATALKLLDPCEYVSSAPHLYEAASVKDVDELFRLARFHFSHLSSRKKGSLGLSLGDPLLRQLDVFRVQFAADSVAAQFGRNG
jgi:hypothetical protein